MKKRYFFIIIFLCIFFIYSTNVSQIPSKVFLLRGEELKIKKIFGLEIVETKNIIKETWQDQNLETTQMDVILFGSVKVKEISVTTYPKIKVIPTGSLIGLKLYTNGVLVIGTNELTNMEGDIEKTYEPADIKEGDTIIEVDNKEIDSTKTLQNIISNSNGQDLEVKFSRGGEEYTTTIKPVQTEVNEYKLGLWVRDSASGVGTMAFYEPESKRFAALGHGISDNDTGELLDIGAGDIVNSKVVNITKGRKGIPGEIKGSIIKENTIGEVIRNTNFGIFGILNDFQPDLSKYSDGIEVALREEIELGPATIISTLATGETEEYEVEIIEIDNQNNENNKSMQIKVTDQRLIEKSGGIICGMSGSPIIQNNKLIGCLTNVLVADPTVGYGVFADIMIKEMVK